MISRKTIACIIGLFCLFLAEAASAQPRWGRERVPNQGACFYEDINFRGDYFCVRQDDRLPRLPSGMGDKISSVRVFGSAEVTVFRDADMRGRSARFIDDVRNLKGEGWNDQISSVDVTSGRDYSGFGGYGGNRGRARGRGPRWLGQRSGARVGQERADAARRRLFLRGRRFPWPVFLRAPWRHLYGAAARLQRSHFVRSACSAPR